jgi:hypothetical protein
MDRKEKKMKSGLLQKVFCLTMTILLLAGCKGASVKPPTCDVYVSGNEIIVEINLPAEETAYIDRHDLTPQGFTGTPSEITIESGGSSVNYSQTGNTYNIAYTVNYKDGDIKGYHISIKGDVYGDVEHTCTK